MDEFTLKSTQFRREREPAWRDLENLVERAEKYGLRRLAEEDLHALPVLYRSAVNGLAVARAISLDRNLLDYLTALVERAYVCVYSLKRRPWEVVGDFLTRRFPVHVRLFGREIALAALLMALGVWCGMALTLRDPGRFSSFVPPGLAGGRTPAASTEELREVLYKEPDSNEWLQVFSAFLFVNNGQVGILCAALGVAAGLPSAYLLFSNGLSLGAMAALYQERGLGIEFWGWVLPHGVTELLAVVLCGAAGMAFGKSLVFPGRKSRLNALAESGKKGGILVVGGLSMLVPAALIEGFFRQLVTDAMSRWSVALGTAVLWSLYFLLAGRKSSNHEAA